MGVPLYFCHQQPQTEAIGIGLVAHPRGWRATRPLGHDEDNIHEMQLFPAEQYSWHTEAFGLVVA